MRSEVCKNLLFYTHVCSVVEWRVWCAKLRSLISLFFLYVFPPSLFVSKPGLRMWEVSVSVNGAARPGEGGQTGSPPQVKFNFPRDCLFWSNPIRTTKSIAMAFYEKFSFVSTESPYHQKFPVFPHQIAFTCVPVLDSANFVCRGPLYLCPSVS